MNTAVSKTLASMSEMVRVGGWALRGAGFPFGVAERGTRLLAWTEAVHGGAVQDICAHEPSIARSQTLKGAVPRRRADGGWKVAGAGRHLIEIGPPVVDLVTSDARLSTTGSVRLCETNGFVFLAALANLLVQRQLVGLVIYRAPESDKLPKSFARAGWIFCGMRDGRPFFAEGAAEDSLTRDVQRAADTILPGICSTTTLMRSRLPDNGFLEVTALTPDHNLAVELVGLAKGSNAAASLRNYPERISDAFRNGVPMEPQDLQDLYDLEIRTWAPTSERSRSQAGYGKYTATAG
jgi:hypothetical protein